VAVTVADCFGLAGRVFLQQAELAGSYRARVDSLLRLIDTLGEEIASFEADVASCLAGHPGYHAIQAIPGVGPVPAAIFVAEIGDVSRFPGPDQLCSWAGLTPRHRESDTKVRRGRTTKQGSRLVRWAAVEAVGRQRGATPIREAQHRIATRRGVNGIGRVAAARKLLVLVYYGLRDGYIRCLADAG
jgi:transposase